MGMAFLVCLLIVVLLYALVIRSRFATETRALEAARQELLKARRDCAASVERFRKQAMLLHCKQSSPSDPTHNEGEYHHWPVVIRDGRLDVLRLTEGQYAEAVRAAENNAYDMPSFTAKLVNDFRAVPEEKRG